MLWLVDSAHLSTRVNHLFALPKQAPNNLETSSQSIKSEAMSKLALKCSANTTDFQRKNGNFFKRPRARNNRPISEFLTPDKFSRCWEHVFKISATNI